MREYVFAKDNFLNLQKVLGERPGEYRLDPFYLRKALADKPMFWNYEKKIWERVSLGDVFVIDDEGFVTRIPVAEVGSKAS